MDELDEIHAGPEDVHNHGHGEQHVALRHGEAEPASITSVANPGLYES